jgi:large subunit ribosomal protein L14
MIQQETILKVTDNSGARSVKCIKILGGFKKKTAHSGDIIVVSVKTIRNFSKIQKGEIYKALVLRTKTKINEKDGCCTKLFDNAVSLIHKQGKKLTPIASRIVGSVPKIISIKFPEFAKISSNEII